jgi:hypothetical protein
MRLRTLALAGLIAVSGQQVAYAATATPSSTTAAAPLAEAFAKAAGTYEVPQDLLVAVGYAETHLDNHDGEPSASGGYGIMHLVSNPKVKTLEEAARLTSQPVSALKTDDAANVLGGAAVLRARADRLGLDETERKDPAKWYGAVAAYSGAADDSTAKLYADAVYEVLGDGVNVAGVRIAPRSVQPDLGEYADAEPRALAAAVDYPGAIWKAAHSSNYAVSNRPTSDRIDRIVIHVTQGSYAGAISWFQTGPRPNPTSAHYVIRSSDGQITQMVREKDRAFHAGNYNRRSVGIEHEGYVNNASWFTDQMYRASAALTRAIANRYGIPKDRTHIVGHHAVPGADHTDPGPHWNWSKYMSYVTGGSGTTPPPTNPHTPQKVCGTGYKIVDSRSLGADGTVYLLYNSASGNNCVATLKKTSLTKTTAISAFLEIQGGSRKTDSGNFQYYAGPIVAAAPGKCVKWGGRAGTTTYTSPFEHCG